MSERVIVGIAYAIFVGIIIVVVLATYYLR